eukprot:763418-Hanusia_phi.AAC.21
MDAPGRGERERSWRQEEEEEEEEKGGGEEEGVVAFAILLSPSLSRRSILARFDVRSQAHPPQSSIMVGVGVVAVVGIRGS